MRPKIGFSLVTVALLMAMSGSVAAAAGGDSFTTTNPHVDGPSTAACKNPSANCNQYVGKEYVWLNGDALAQNLRQDGEYFFAVLEPGGQQDPNDGSQKNLSDDHDTYADRTFTVAGGELAYTGSTHWLDSGKTEPGDVDPALNGLPPYIRLFPFADTTNPGGVYILAVCSLQGGYPVEPRACNYEAFMVREGNAQSSLYFSGWVFEDMFADGARDVIDAGLKHWQVMVTGSAADGQAFSGEARTDKDGYWEYEAPVMEQAEDQAPLEMSLSFCAELQEGWTRSYPEGDGCHTLNVDASTVGSFLDLNFGNWYPLEITACGERQKNNAKEPVTDLVVSLSREGEVLDTRAAGVDGCVNWTGLTPGFVYSVRAESGLEGFAPGSLEHVFPRAKSGERLSHSFVDMMEGCTPGFWQGGNGIGSAGGKWLWNQPNDPDWLLSGGAGWNPFVWTTRFNDFFTPYEGLQDFDMLALVDKGGGSDDYQKAARDLVAATLNAAWGMNYPYTTDQLAAMWAAAVASGDFHGLHIELDTANNAYQNGGNGTCPIDASHDGEIPKVFLPIILR